MLKPEPMLMQTAPLRAKYLPELPPPANDADADADGGARSDITAHWSKAAHVRVLERWRGH
jgi:hypothetical protein